MVAVHCSKQSAIHPVATDEQCEERSQKRNAETQMKISDLTYYTVRDYLLPRIIDNGVNNSQRVANQSEFNRWKSQAILRYGDAPVEIVKESKQSKFKIIISNA
jgi:hypothetical protein